MVTVLAIVLLALSREEVMISRLAGIVCVIAGTYGGKTTAARIRDNDASNRASREEQERPQCLPYAQVTRSELEARL